ncbi:hypothetical protein VTN00DRAFT_4290 [Thermoascus crustaceus]|uniref:uncharacterized protein n=1 Tax=Thermoascus crustaceus TaxID=5088 RepID=UPI003743C469
MQGRKAASEHEGYGTRAARTLAGSRRGVEAVDVGQTVGRDALRTEQKSDCPRTHNLAVFPGSGLDAYRPQFGQAGSTGN